MGATVESHPSRTQNAQNLAFQQNFFANHRRTGLALEEFFEICCLFLRTDADVHLAGHFSFLRRRGDFPHRVLPQRLIQTLSGSDIKRTVGQTAKNVHEPHEDIVSGERGGRNVFFAEN